MSESLNEIKKCDCQINYDTYPEVEGEWVDCYYHGQGVWQCPECGLISDYSDRVYQLVLEYLYDEEDECLIVKPIEYDERLNESPSSEYPNYKFIDSIMEDIREGGGWSYNGIEGHSIGIFKTEVYWYYYRCSYEYEEYDLDMYILSEEKQ